MAISINVEFAKTNFECVLEELIQKAVSEITDEDIEQEKTVLLGQIGNKNSIFFYDPLQYVAKLIDTIKGNVPYKTHISIDEGNIEVNVVGKNGAFSNDGLNLEDYPKNGAFEVVEITKRLCAHDMALYQLMTEGYLMPLVSDNRERLYFNVRCNNGNRAFTVIRDRFAFNKFLVIKEHD